MIALATAKVKCGGKMHRISVMPSGKLRFHDHDQSLWLAEDLAEAAGFTIPPACRCAAELRWFRGDRPSNLRPHPAQRGSYSRHLDGTNVVKNSDNALRKYRLRPKSAKTVPLGESPSLIERCTARDDKAAREVFEQTNYRKPSGKWAGGEVELAILHRGELIVVNEMTQPRLDGATCSSKLESVRSTNNKWSGNNLLINLQIPAFWFGRVYRKGLAIVDGSLFVLDVEPKGRYHYSAIPGAVLALVVKQSTGLSLEPVWALIHPEPKPRVVKWLKNEDVAYVQT